MVTRWRRALSRWAPPVTAHQRLLQRQRNQWLALQPLWRVATAQLQELRLTIDRYAKEKAAHDAERDGFTDKITYLTRERMRIYARLAETQMVLLSKNKALVDATAQARKFRIAATLKAAATIPVGSATSSTPLVSLSSRWTSRGRTSSSPGA